jgi:DNA repair protein RadA/Sms
MAKTVVHYLCRSCGGVQSRWMGKCPDCGTWDALEKYTEPKVKAGAGQSGDGGLIEIWAGGDDGPATGAARAAAIPLPDIVAADVARQPTGIGEFDRVLGGGLVTGSVVLLGGAPGIGKSTLMLQAAAILAARGRRVLYVTSEESAYQTKLRAERLFENDGAEASMSELYVLADTNLARIVEQARKVRPAVTVIDSIQMVYKPDVEAAPGAVAQVRRCCTELVCLAKISGMAIVLVGHVTKDGQIAGPKLLEHLVDVVLSFEGDRHLAHRVVRGIKNRYGTTLEVGLFEMTGRGLKELTDAAMIDPAARPQPGSVICPAMHGTRCLLVEMQALTATGFLGSAKRRTSGVDANRLAMLIAVLEKHGGLRLADQDVFASAVGGLKVVEPAADLALALAIAGAHYRRALDPGTAVIGEVGLGGEIRPVHQVEQRIREARRRGFRTLIVPSDGGFVSDGELVVHPARTIGVAVDMLTACASTSGPPRPGGVAS